VKEYGKKILTSLFLDLFLPEDFFQFGGPHKRVGAHLC